jgi:hypothetical protein
MKDAIEIVRGFIAEREQYAGADWYDPKLTDALAKVVDAAEAAAAAVRQERERHMRMHRRTNDLLRSCYMVAEREMDRPNSTSWDALRTRLRELLQLQRDFDASMPPTPEASRT